jgi:DNA-directed RNA polymerase III subunit RPC7
MPQAKASLSFGDALAKLRELERTEAETKGNAAGSDEEDGQDNEDEVVYDEEEFEDETDYNFSYFDNGEDYGDYDDGDEGPVY